MIKMFVRNYLISVLMTAFIVGAYLGITGGSVSDFLGVMQGVLIGCALISGAFTVYAWWGQRR